MNAGDLVAVSRRALRPRGLLEQENAKDGDQNLEAVNT